MSSQTDYEGEGARITSIRNGRGVITADPTYLKGRHATIRNNFTPGNVMTYEKRANYRED